MLHAIVAWPPARCEPRVSPHGRCRTAWSRAILVEPVETSYLVAAGAALPPLVADLGLCLVSAAVLSVVFQKLRIPSIAALLGAGVVLGPTGLAAIQDHASIDTIANLGLTLLLFVIGLEVNVKSLLASGRTLVITGLVQVPLSILLGFGVFLLIGMTGISLVADTYSALYLGVACAFSSTLLVAKYLQQHLLVDTTGGRLAIGLLIFQDIWAIVFLALQHSISSPSIWPILYTLAGTVVLLVVAIVVARYVLAYAFDVVARSPELVVTLALGWCFGVGLLGSHLGPLTVSLEMGALIAGATIATSPYAYEVVSRVVHLRDFFVTLFFVGLGMTIPMPDGFAVVLVALILAVVAVATRYVIFLPLLYLTGLDRRNSVAVSTRLAQVSEFCLVIAYLGARLGHISGDHVSVVIFAFVCTALLTPFLFSAADQLYKRLRDFLDHIGIRSRGPIADTEQHDAPRLVLLGFHRIGSAVLADLERLYPELVPQTLVVDTNAAVHDEIRKRGAQVLYGDIGSIEVLRHAGVGAAEVIVSTVPDELLRGVTNADLARALRELAPNATIIVNCMRRSQVEAVLQAGADHVFRPPKEVASSILPAIYAALNASLPSYLEATVDRRSGHDEVID